MANRQHNFRPEKFAENLEKLATLERAPRTVDVLIQFQEAILPHLRAGRPDKEVYDALRDSNYSVSYPAFQRAMAQFREAMKLPTRKEVRRQLFHAGRFLRDAKSAEQGNPSGRPKLSKGKLGLLKTEDVLSAEARAL